MSRKRQRHGTDREALTNACVLAPASEKLMNNHVESLKTLNSDAITGWVASTSDPSALEVKIPINRTIMTRIIELCVPCFDIGAAMDD